MEWVKMEWVKMEWVKMEWDHRRGRLQGRTAHATVRLSVNVR
jgi:hypothetical protein